MKETLVKYFIIFSLCLIGLCISNNIAYAAPVPVLNYFTCDSSSGTAGTISWPTYPFTWTCHANVTMGNQSGNAPKINMVFHTDSTTATKDSGHGSNIDYKSGTPTNRFTGKYSASSAVNMNGTTDVVVMNAVSLSKGSTATYDFTFNFNTYEADYGDTQYHIAGLVCKLENNADSTVYRTVNYRPDFYFTIPNKQYVTISTNPSLSLTSVQTKALSQYYDSNSPITVTVKANNTWRLQTMLDSAPQSGSNTIPITSNYFKASGSGFSNLASSSVQYAATDTYYDVAKNLSGVYYTGTSDGKNLLGVSVTFTPDLYTSSFFNKGSYTSPIYFQLFSP